MAALAVAALTAVVLAGCSGDPETPAPTQAAPVEPSWNPCSSLDAAAVAKLFATPYSVQRGTAGAPTCTFVPETEGDPAVDINYVTSGMTLQETFKTFGETEAPGRTTVGVPTVRGADEARVVTDVSDDTLAVTGYVRNGELVQIVNAIDPGPFDRTGLTRDVEALLADLAAGADTSGLVG